MKRILSFGLMAVTVLAVIVFAAIPHHHHKEVVCMTMERCGLDGSYNDEHTGHSSDSGEEFCPETVNLTTILSSKSRTESLPNGFTSLFIPVFYFLADTGQGGVDESSLPVYVVYRINYASALLGAKSGLRAPPRPFL